MIELKVGKKYQYRKHLDIVDGEIKYAPIDWTIVEVFGADMAIAIADKVLDCCAFDDKSNEYDESFLRMHVKYILGENAFIPSEKQLVRWFPNAEDRRAKATEYAAKKGVVCGKDNYAYYWTNSPSPSWYNNVRYVTSSGQFHGNNTDGSHFGVRPALLIRRNKHDRF